jgi:uracil-DNA glycosylase
MIPAGWKNVLSEEIEKDYFRRLDEFVSFEYENGTIYPEADNIFTALELTPFDSVKVLLLGQDPYHGEGQAHGLCFSVKPGIKVPPSLRNIYKELSADMNCPLPHHGSLKKWAGQGVLMLNTVLTVRAGLANSHRGRGWEDFTDAVIRAVNAKKSPVVFVLWGNPAKKKLPLIDRDRHHIISSAHPSPLSASRGFMGSRPFSKINLLLEKNRDIPVDWSITDEVQAELPLF